MPRFRKKPVVIEAVQFTGTNRDEVLAFAGKDINDTVVEGDVRFPAMFIPTLEGVMEASVGDWIIRGVAGELYPCKPEIFEATYDPENG